MAIDLSKNQLPKIYRLGRADTKNYSNLERKKVTRAAKNRTPSAVRLGSEFVASPGFHRWNSRGDARAQLGLEPRFKCRSRRTSINPSSERAFCWLMGVRLAARQAP